jgi:hypothetical protein
MAPFWRRSWDWLLANGSAVAVEGLVNFIAPVVIYDLCRRSLGDVRALLASSGPPILWSLIEFARRRRVDALSILVLAGIALSLAAFVGGGGARFLQMREKLVTVLIGLLFLGSAAVRRPLIYYLARATLKRRNSDELASFEAMKDNVYFRRTMTVLTVVWGVGLLADAAVSVGLIFTLSIHDYLLAGPAVGYGTIGGLTLWTLWYVRRQRARGEARRRREASEATGSRDQRPIP